MIVGVAVGFAAFAVMVLALIFYFARRQTRARQADEVVLVGDTGTSEAWVGKWSCPPLPIPCSLTVAVDKQEQDKQMKLS